MIFWKTVIAIVISFVCFLLFQEKCSLLSPLCHFNISRTQIPITLKFGKQAESGIRIGTSIFLGKPGGPVGTDSINHDILLQKLDNIGLDQTFINWIESYLKNRTQYVLLNGYKSKSLIVHSGVPQGSHLGPLLFNVFINDILNVIKSSTCLLYADDLKVFAKVQCIDDAVKLQRDVDAIADWCILNKLDLNLKKCNIMSFSKLKTCLTFNYSIWSCVLSRVDSIKDLGIIFVPSLSFGQHVDYTVARASMVLGFIIRNTGDFTNTSALNLLYTSLVRSILEYGVVIWNSPHCTISNRLEAVQKRYIRFYFRKIQWPYNKSLPYWENLKLLPPYKERCEIAGLQSLFSRRECLCAQFVSDIICARVDSSNLLSKLNFNVPSYSIRGFKPMYLEAHRANYLNYASLPYACDKFNFYFYCFDFNLSKVKFKLAI